MGKEQLVRKANESYGFVPPGEYLKLLEESRNPENAEETLREDYELGVDTEGLFSVSYSASCESCDFSFKFKHSERVT